MFSRRSSVATVALGAALALGLAACGGTSSGGGSPATTSGDANTFNSGTAKAGGSITIALEKNIQDWNINSANGNTQDTGYVTNTIYPLGPFTQLPDLSTPLNTDLMVSADLTSSSPETVVYKIKPSATWSDGVPINIDDFVYSWQTQNGTNAGYQPASTTGYEDIQSVTGSDGGKTVTVVYKTKFADWKSLFTNLLPAHYMKTLNSDPVKAFNTGLQAGFPKISGGPYLIKSFASNSSITLVKNPKWYGTPVKLDTIVFRIITDATTEPPALQNREVQLIYPQPQVDLVNQTKSIPDVITQLQLGLQFEHFDFNLANPYLKDKALRQAIFMAVDRKALIAGTVGQFDKDVTPLGNRMFVPQQKGYQNNSGAYGAGDIAKAKSILTAAGYKIAGGSLTDPSGKKVPAFNYVYTVGNQIRERQGEILGQEVAPLGIKINIKTTDDLGNALSTHSFDIIDFAWVAQPYPFSISKALYITGGGSNYDSYSNKTVDGLMSDAAGQLDQAKAITDLNSADKILTDDAVTLPLYQKPDYLAVYKTYVNVRGNPTLLGYSYNAPQWGMKAS